MSPLLKSIDSPEKIRALSSGQLVQLVASLREELITTVSRSGGHFASSLGAAELTVVLHHLFNTPKDKLIWDTGHQCYIHKMLTGRGGELGSIRQKGGLSGFLKRSESRFDAFGAGHAGTSISAGVGMRVALDRIEPERYVVPIIGDGSLTSGMAFEALNHAGDLGLKNFIVVINDNEMSISPNVGALSWLFSKTVTSELSSRARHRFKELYRQGYMPRFIYRAVDRAEEAAQGFFASPSMLFEAFGFRYIGPVDGHSVEDLLTAFHNAKQQDVPVIVHARTMKGKGFTSAEDDPIKWHAVKPFSPPTSERGQSDPLPVEKAAARAKEQEASEEKKAILAPLPASPTYTQVFAHTTCRLATENPKIVGITAAMAEGTGLEELRRFKPEAFFDVGICEQHAVTFAAGLACEGLTPICAIYSTFLQRGFDQVVHDVAIQKLPVVFAVDRAGVVGNDGETHQGVFDIAFLRSIPELVLMAAADENELKDMLYTATKMSQPSVVRYPRGKGPGVVVEDEFCAIPIGKSRTIETGEAVLLLSYGGVLGTVKEAASTITRETGKQVTVVDMRFAKPLDINALRELVPTHQVVCTIEDHAVQGGFGSAVLEAINDYCIETQSPLLRFGVHDDFVPHASQQEQYEMLGFNASSIVERVLERLGEAKLRAVRV